MRYKYCAKCGKLKAPHEYNKRSATKDGLQSYCRECQRGYSVAHEEISAELLREIDSHWETRILPCGVKYFQYKEVV